MDAEALSAWFPDWLENQLERDENLPLDPASTSLRPDSVRLRGGAHITAVRGGALRSFWHAAH